MVEIEQANSLVPEDAQEFKDEGRGSYVYFLMRDDVCVYVGQTVNLKRRLWEHGKKDYDKALFIHVADDVRISVESDFIDRIEPEYNKDKNLDKRSLDGKSGASIVFRLRVSKAMMDELNAVCKEFGLNRADLVRNGLNLVIEKSKRKRAKR